MVVAKVGIDNVDQYIVGKPNGGILDSTLCCKIPKCSNINLKIR